MWSRPVTRTGAGRLLVVGGHAKDFSAPTANYRYAVAAGVGECRVLLPDSLMKLVGGTPGVSFVPSSLSGSLGRAALGEILLASEDADSVVIGGSLSNNSETAILLEELIRRIKRPTVIYGEVLEIVSLNPKLLVESSDNLLILTMSEVFKLAGRLMIPIRLRRDAGIINKLEIIQAITAETSCQIVTYGTEIIVACGGELTVTQVPFQLVKQTEAIVATLATFWLQNPSQPLAGLTMGAYILAQAANEVDPDKLSSSELERAISKTIARDDLAGF